MRRLVVLAGLTLCAPLLIAAAPVTITNAGNTATATITSSRLDVNATIAAGGSTQDVNLKQVNGVAVNVGTGTASTGTQRVAVASDSSIVLAAGSAIAGKVGVDQTTPGTTNLVSGSSQSGAAAWEAAFTCTSQASVNVTAGSTTEIVALSGSTVIRVCSVSLGISASGTVALLSGTGTNCGTPAQSMQPINLATGNVWAQSAPAGSAIYRGSAGGELCIAAVTGNVVGFVTYAQF